MVVLYMTPDNEPLSDDNHGSNIDRRWCRAMFVCCALLYLCIYATEAPIRYGLFLAGKDSLIFVRDALMIVPLLLLIAWQALRLQLHPAFFVVGVLVTFHGLVLMGTVGSIGGVAYGVKILMNVLFGFFAAALLIAPGPKTLKVLAVIWLTIIVGL